MKEPSHTGIIICVSERKSLIININLNISLQCASKFWSFLKKIISIESLFIGPNKFFFAECQAMRYHEQVSAISCEFYAPSVEKTIVCCVLCTSIHMRRRARLSLYISM